MLSKHVKLVQYYVTCDNGVTLHDAVGTRKRESEIVVFAFPKMISTFSSKTGLTATSMAYRPPLVPTTHPVTPAAAAAPRPAPNITDDYER
jgi:hypothetical protein